MLGLATTFIFSTCAFFLFLYFLNKLSRIKRTTAEILPFVGLAVVFLFQAISFFVVGWFDYFKWQFNDIYNGLLKFYVLSLIGSLGIMVFLFEYTLKKTKYIISLYTLVNVAILFFTTDYAQLTFLGTMLVAPILLCCIPLWYFSFIKPISGTLKQRMFFALFGNISIGIGFAFRLDEFNETFGYYFYSLGTIISIIGVCLMGFGFMGFSTLTDLNWKKKLREIFVIFKNGVCLYAFSFEKNSPIEDSDLVAGGFSGIQLLLSEMVKTEEKIRLIDYQNLKIMLEQKMDTSFILISKEESKILQYKLKLFSDEFEYFFGSVIKQWNGDVALFRPLYGIIQRIFLET